MLTRPQPTIVRPMIIAPGGKPTTLVNVPQRSVQQAQPQTPIAETTQRQNDSGPINEPARRPEPKPLITQPFETLIPMVTGVAVPLSTQKFYFRQGWLSGIQSFGPTAAFPDTLPGIPNPNANNIQAGNRAAYLWWQITPYEGIYSIGLNAPIGYAFEPGHLYDLSQIFAMGTTGDFLFISVE